MTDYQKIQCLIDEMATGERLRFDTKLEWDYSRTLRNKCQDILVLLRKLDESCEIEEKRELVSKLIMQIQYSGRGFFNRAKNTPECKAQRAVSRIVRKRIAELIS